jgi:diguanylate cyclase (GGDEF)-like protein
VEEMLETELSATENRPIKEALILQLSGVLAITVTPFAYIRLRDAQWSMAVFDIGIVCIMLLLFIFVYVSRRTRTAGVFMALGFISAALMTTLLLGASQVFWAYPALVTAYFMLDTRQAVVLSVGFLCCFLAILWGEIPAVDLATIFLTLVTTILLANAFALTNRRQQASLRHMANVDPLTGAGNRRSQNQKLDAVHAIFRRSNAPGSVLMMDVDHFKKINDTHGHVVGDQVLVEIAGLIRSCTRATETLYRYGGEEFVVIAEQTNIEAAAKLADKLRATIEHKVFSTGVRLSVSVGVAELRAGEERQAWLSRADVALFQAKGRGRNQVILADNPESVVIPINVASTVEGMS